jgi:hypothetical protein
VLKEAEEQAKTEAEEQARQEAEEQATEKAEEQARKEAEEQARKEAEEQERKEAEEKVRNEVEECARKEAEEQARKEAEEQARKEAEEQARKEAEEQARKEAEEQARKEAEEQARKEAEEQARKEAEDQARKEAEERARVRAEEQAKKLAEDKQRQIWLEAETVKKGAEEEAAVAKAEAEQAKAAMELAMAEAEAAKAATEEARADAEKQIQAMKEKKARMEAAEQARTEKVEQARKEAEEQARKEAFEEGKRQAEEQAKRDTEEQARKEAEEQARKEAFEEGKRQAEEQAKRDTKEQARKEAEEQARREAEDRIRVEAFEQGKQEAAEQARKEAEEQAKKDVDEQATREEADRVRAEAFEEGKRHAEEQQTKRELMQEQRTKFEALDETGGVPTPMLVPVPAVEGLAQPATPVEGFSTPTTPLRIKKADLVQFLIERDPARVSEIDHLLAENSAAEIRDMFTEKYGAVPKCLQTPKKVSNKGKKMKSRKVKNSSIAVMAEEDITTAALKWSKERKKMEAAAAGKDLPMEGADGGEGADMRGKEDGPISAAPSDEGTGLLGSLGGSLGGLSMSSLGDFSKLREINDGLIEAAAQLTVETMDKAAALSDVVSERVKEGVKDMQQHTQVYRERVNELQQQLKEDLEGKSIYDLLEDAAGGAGGGRSPVSAGGAASNPFGPEDTADLEAVRGIDLSGLLWQVPPESDDERGRMEWLAGSDSGDAEGGNAEDSLPRTLSAEEDVYEVSLEAAQGELLGLTLRPLPGANERLPPFVLSNEQPQAGKTKESADINAGDLLLAINGKAAAAMPVKDVMRLLYTAPRPLQLTLQRTVNEGDVASACSPWAQTVQLLMRLEGRRQKATRERQQQLLLLQQQAQQVEQAGVEELFRKELIRIYREFNPEKEGEIAYILSKYAGREARLFVLLRKKYACELDPQLCRTLGIVDKPIAVAAPGAAEENSAALEAKSAAPEDNSAAPEANSAAAAGVNSAAGGGGASQGNAGEGEQATGAVISGVRGTDSVADVAQQDGAEGKDEGDAGNGAGARMLGMFSKSVSGSVEGAGGLFSGLKSQSVEGAGGLFSGLKSQYEKLAEKSKDPVAAGSTATAAGESEDASSAVPRPIARIFTSKMLAEFYQQVPPPLHV